MGSSGGSASRAAQQSEDQRRRAIELAQKRVEGIFSSPARGQQIQDFIDAFGLAQQTELNRLKKVNTRNLKFSLAGAGLAGGSVDSDLNRNLAETFVRGTVDAERRAQGAGAELRQADTSSKLSLFSQILGGLDTTTAAQNAGQALRQNVSSASSFRTQGNFDNLVSRFGDLFTASREAKGRRRQAEQSGAIYGPRPTVQSYAAGGI